MSRSFFNGVDEKTSTIVKVSRLAAGTIVAAIAAMFYMVLAL